MATGVQPWQSEQLKMLTMSPRKTWKFLRMHLFSWTFTGSTWSSDSTGATVSQQHLPFWRKNVKRS
jgi:hypothetical protein